MFAKNYLYELPEDIQIIIYKKVFAKCIYDIDNERCLKYLNRLYRAVNNPNNTCIYSIRPKGLFYDIHYIHDNRDSICKGYKYKCVAMLENFGHNTIATSIKDMIYLDRAYLIEDTSQLQSNIISYYLYPLITSKKSLKKYLTIRFNLVKYYDKKLITNIIVNEDRIDIIFKHNLQCNADIYYNIMVGYNIPIYTYIYLYIPIYTYIPIYILYIQIIEYLYNKN
jgi:hypothetical protein